MINILIREFAPKQAVADQEAMEQFQKQWPKVALEIRHEFLSNPWAHSREPNSR
jgi:hypothetical protein